MTLKQINKIFLITAIATSILFLEVLISYLIFGNNIEGLFVPILAFGIIYIDGLTVYFLNRKFHILEKLYKWIDKE